MVQVNLIINYFEHDESTKLIGKKSTLSFENISLMEAQQKSEEFLTRVCEGLVIPVDIVETFITL